MRMIHPSMLLAGPGPKLAGSKESYAPEACSRSLAAACPRPCGFLDRIVRSDRAGDVTIDRGTNRVSAGDRRAGRARGGAVGRGGGRTRARGRRESLSSRTEKRRVERTRGWAKRSFHLVRSLGDGRSTDLRRAPVLRRRARVHRVHGDVVGHHPALAHRASRPRRRAGGVTRPAALAPSARVRVRSVFRGGSLCSKKKKQNGEAIDRAERASHFNTAPTRRRRI